MLHNRSFEIASNPEYDGHQRQSATRADTANEKRIKNKVYTPFMDNICGAKWITCTY